MWRQRDQSWSILFALHFLVWLKNANTAMIVFGKTIAADIRHFVAEAVYLATSEVQHCRGQRVLYLIQELMNEFVSHPPSFISKGCRNLW